MGKEIKWELDDDTQARMHRVCRSLRTSYVEFIGFAVRQALDEAEALAQEQQAIRNYYRNINE